MKPKKNKPVKKPILWGDHIRYQCLPYVLNKKHLPKMISKPATDSNFVRDFSMKYDDKANKIGTASTTKPKV